MLNLNLLAPEKKREISKHMIFVSVQFFISWILIAVCVTGIILLITKLMMQNSFNQAVKQGTLVTQEYGALNQKVYTTNNKIDFLENIQKNFIVWSEKLTILTTLVPNNIQLVSLNLNQITKDVQIEGHADTRADLLLYKNQLEQSGALETIDLPLEHLLESTNIEFKINAKIKL